MIKLSTINIIHHLQSTNIPQGGPFPTHGTTVLSKALLIIFPASIYSGKVVRAGNGTSQMITINLITFITCCECN